MTRPLVVPYISSTPFIIHPVVNAAMALLYSLKDAGLRQDGLIAMIVYGMTPMTKGMAKAYII